MTEKRKRNLAGMYAYPVIVILKEKHSTGHFIINSDEEMGKLARETVNRRWENSWYGTIESARKCLEQHQAELIIAEQALEAAESAQGLPEYTVKEFHRKVDRLRSSIKEDEEVIKETVLIQEFISTQIPELAVEILWAHRDYEYENIEVKGSGWS